MSDNFERLPLAEADQQYRAAIETHRTAMSTLGKARASRIAAEVAARGRTGVAEVAAELGLSESAVRRLLVEARKT
ncbi:helix-turn-helix domain-containing protein [Glycomyces paridis]|uniref:Helix-turn-helix domain-containing protein n=1 Tax=Glycomyces paridis TaxID=2126555 RepID=A0A4S8P6Y1_9ACTN|nr:helix-turn-helix domain-containing protein [Glycomyces paridis]THV26020.1 hypothetical protein E9998_20020 [Glycomyces paridis]